MTEGWVYVGEAEQISNYNVLWCDTIGISNSIASTYPCLFSFLNDSLANINYLAQFAGASVFKDSTYMHLTFDTSINNTTDTDTVAVTRYTNLIIDQTGKTHFYAIIEFNGWFLRNETKEYMVCSILHEAMHAVFKLRWKQYEVWRNTNPHQGTIDSFFMKSHFPIYWENYVQNGIPSGSINDHEIMATDYFNYFASLISPFYNPNAPQGLKDTVIKAMSFTGLSKSTAWKLLPSQGIDTCKYKNIIATAQRSLIGNHHVGSCPNFTAHYADSLQLRPNCN